MDRISHPSAQPAGQSGSRRQTLVPVSNAVTGARSAFGAPSLRYCARKGASISRRKVSAVSESKRIAPSELPSRMAWPWRQGPSTRKTLSSPSSFGSIAS